MKLISLCVINFNLFYPFFLTYSGLYKCCLLSLTMILHNFSMRYQILLILGIFIPINTNAQDWFEGSPAWSYEYHCGFWEETYGYDNIRFIKDTILDDKLMKMFSEEKQRTTVGPNSQTWNTVQMIFFYESENKIWQFIPQNNYHKLLYDYELTSGDTLFIESDPGDLCGDTLFYIVDSTGIINIGSYELEFQDLIIEDSTNYFEDETIRIIEKVGVIGYNYFDIKLNYSCIVDACRQFTFTCYENEEIELFYPENINCEVLSYNFNLNDQSLKIYPNPIQDFFFLGDMERYESVRIIDINGKVLSHQKIDSNKINFVAPPGIYFVILQDKEGKTTTSKVVKE